MADTGHVPFRSGFDLALSHRDIFDTANKLMDAGVIPVAVGGDHSVSHPVLKAVGGKRPVGMIHIDAHCDTGGVYEGQKFYHGGSFHNTVLDGVLDPKRTIQIGIRGAAEYIWKFSTAAGLTVVHASEIDELGDAAIIVPAREVIGDGPTYLSFDVDSLDPTFSPGTGAPETGGLSMLKALALVRGLQGLNLVNGDVVEVAPAYDPTTNIAKNGAQMLFEILSFMLFSPALSGK